MMTKTVAKQTNTDFQANVCKLHLVDTITRSYSCNTPLHCKVTTRCLKPENILLKDDTAVSGIKV